jgi:polysaccharide pyruvyl transferase CsaB
VTTRVLVSAWIGSTNLGDELVFAGLRRLLAARDAAVAAVTVDPVGTARAHGVATIDHRDPLRLWSQLASTDVLVLGGGGLLQDATSPFNVPYHLARPLIGHLRGVPWAAVGLGAGPLRGVIARRAARFLRTAVAVTVRHDGANHVLTGCGVDDVGTAADLAFALPARQPVPADVVTVSLRPWAGQFASRRPVASGRLADATPDWFVDEAAAALDAISQATGLRIRFVPLQTDRDAVFAQRVANRMHEPHEQVVPSLSSVVDDIGAGRVVVAMRYHAAVAAVLSGRPVVSLSYSPKTDRLAADIGSAGTLVPWRRDALPDLCDAVATTLRHLDGREGAAQEAAVRMRARGMANGAALDRLLETVGGA